VESAAVRPGGWGGGGGGGGTGGGHNLLITGANGSGKSSHGR
jgi:hypothetical protein